MQNTAIHDAALVKIAHRQEFEREARCATGSKSSSILKILNLG